MRKAALAASAALALLAPAAANAVDPFFPTFGNNGYDVVNYDLDLKTLVRPNGLAGKAVITLTAEKRLTSFTLDLHALKVSSVTIDGTAVPFSQADDKLLITATRAIRAGTTATVAIVYGGKPDALDDPTLPEPDPCCELGWVNYDGKSSYVLSEPVGASNWYPVNDEPDDKASYRIRIETTKQQTAVANGNLVKVEDLGKTHRFTWVQKQPMASYLATVQVNKFTQTDQEGTNGVPLRYFTTAENSPGDLAVFRKTPEMMALMEGLVAKYPFAAYGSVMVDDPKLYYALETQAMSTFPQGAVYDAIVMHELVHQWFGNSVTVEHWEDLWLAEGFATYYEILWPYRNDPEGFDEEMLGLYAYVAANEVGPAVVDTPFDLFADNTYYRGACTLYALRLQVGEAMFNKIVRNYYKTFKNSNATSQDFIDVAVAVSGDPAVAGLLHDWLYEQPVPPLPASAVARARDVAPALPASAAHMRRAHPLLGAATK